METAMYSHNHSSQAGRLLNRSVINVIDEVINNIDFKNVIKIKKEQWESLKNGVEW